MTAAQQTYDIHTAPEREGFFRRSEAWLDRKGKGAWIAAMILGFVFFWPIGLALLAYMIWGKQMFKSNCAARRSYKTQMTMGSTGNAAFDAYKAETLRRLEEEQASFEKFLERLREAKDKAEFDEFIEDRATPKTEDDA